MIDYGTLDNVDGSFPDAAPTDVSAPGAGDGTKVEAAWGQQAWGFHQAIMDYVGATPDTADEVHDASQLHNALVTGLSPPGVIVGWHGALDPDNVQHSEVRLLPCVGQTVLIADYPTLAAYCYIGDGNNADENFPYWYKSSDAGGVTRDDGGNYITVCDLRGAFLRGKDTTATRDPLGATREFPDFQGDALLEHEHRVKTSSSGKYASIPATATLTDGATVYFMFRGDVTPSGDDLVAEELELGTPSSADEVRPQNVNILWCVRY